MKSVKSDIIAAVFVCLLLVVTSGALERPAGRQELRLQDRGLDASQFRSTDFDSVGLDSFIVNYMQLHHVPGLATAIVKNGEVIWSAAYGNAYFDPFLLATDSTLFMLASISKTLTGTALMQLYEEGEFDLNDPVNDYLPFAVTHPLYPNTDITFRMILTHTSGIQDNWFVMPYYPGDSPIPLGEYLEDYLTPGGAYYNSRLNFTSWEPGTGFSYCNNALALAGYLVEVISGMPFDQYCQENIYAPLSMNETAWFLADLDTMHVAMPYHWDGQTYIPYGHFGYSDYPSGQLRTSAPQLLRFLTAFMQFGQLDTVRILDSATVALMTTPQYPEIDPTQGLVWYNWNFAGRSLWGHNGGDLGVSTEMWYCPDENTGVIALSNGESFLFEILSALFDYASGYGVSLAVNITPHNPPIQIPAAGGDFAYDLQIQNTDTVTVPFDFWINVLMPDSTVFGPVILRQSLSLSSGDTISRDNISQTVPGTVPAGEYTYIANVGQYSSYVVDADSFTFVKLPGLDGVGVGADWSLRGWEADDKSQSAANPAACALLYAFPNPFNAKATLSFNLPEAAVVSLVVYDLVGRKVAELASGWYESGAHQLNFDAAALPSGMYIARLKSGRYVQSQKFILLK